MLADLRAHRIPRTEPPLEQLGAMAEVLNAAVAIGQAVPRYLGFRRTIARAGVAVFAITLLMTMVLSSATRSTHDAFDVLVADANQTRSVNAAIADVSLPNQVAGALRRFATSDPTSAPPAEPPPALTPTPPVPQAAVRGGAGVHISASWYGPGFFENRLPCWQWLQANGLPIQFLPDTWGVAHKTLPCGTMLILTHGSNTVTVPVVDRGPYIAGREIDMSPRIKAALGCTDLCTVLMQIK